MYHNVIVYPVILCKVLCTVVTMKPNFTSVHSSLRSYHSTGSLREDGDGCVGLLLCKHGMSTCNDLLKLSSLPPLFFPQCGLIEKGQDRRYVPAWV